MNLEKIKAKVTNALQTMEPTEVRVCRADTEVVKVLVLSERFKGVSVFDRIDACSKLLVRHADLHYLFIVEPVTPEEFKQRLAPWPE